MKKGITKAPNGYYNMVPVACRLVKKSSHSTAELVFTIVSDDWKGFMTIKSSEVYLEDIYTEKR